MYRGVTLKVLENKIDPNDEAKVAEVAKHIKIELKPHPTQTWILVDGKGLNKIFFFSLCLSPLPTLVLVLDVSKDIRTEAIAKSIGPVAKNPAVRAELVKRQQEMGRTGSVVMDGRDIGTVVFPTAELKGKREKLFFWGVFFFCFISSCLVCCTNRSRC
jgi:cytidylate kinase